MSPDISTGLVLSLDNPWLAASPDGPVYDPTESYPNRVIEFKNPYTARNITLKEATDKTTFCLEHNKDSDTLKVKNKHDYYYHVQCTMYCTQKKWCDLVVRATDVHIERIYYNNDFWIKALSKLKEFYFTATLSEISLSLGRIFRTHCNKRANRTLENNWLDIFKHILYVNTLCAVLYHYLFSEEVPPLNHWILS